MVLRLAMLGALAVAAIGQDGALVGTVSGVDGNEVNVLAGRQSIKFTTKAAVSALHEGDRVRVHFYRDSSSHMIATTISRMVTISGEIRTANANRLEVRTRTGVAAVHLYSNTVFSGDRKLLVEGQDIFVAGWDMGDGTIDAIRIAIYNTDTPVSDAR